MIEIKNLTVRFGDAPPVLDNLNLTVKDKSRTVILGESGSGKSITLAAILRILPPEAKVQGSIVLEGKELFTLSDGDMQKARGSLMGYIPQGSGNGMNPLMTVGTQIAEPLEVHRGLDKKSALTKAREWMERLNLSPAQRLSEAYPHTLSGGMRQRAMMAMGASAGAPVLLADEPTKGLDEKRIADVEALLKEFTDRTVLCVSHDLRFTKRIADVVCVMYGGQSVEIADADAFFRNPLHPYSKMLLAALPENGLKAPGGYAPKDQSATGCPFYDRCPNAFEKCQTPPEMVGFKNHKVRCHRYEPED